MTSVHGPTRMVVSDFRPVPLRYYFADSEGMYKLFEHEEAGPGAKLGLHKAIRPKGMTPAVLPANKGTPTPCVVPSVAPFPLTFCSPVDLCVVRQEGRQEGSVDGQ